MSDRIAAQVEQYLLLGVEKYRLKKVDFKTGHKSIMETSIFPDGGNRLEEDLLNKIYETCDRLLVRIIENKKQFFDISVVLGYSIARGGTTIEVEAHLPVIGTRLVGKL